jgi:murein L,D-transpeptidase YcbB/YkuD
LQQIFGTVVDGVVSNQSASYKASNPGLVSGWDWQAKPNGKGSQLIKALQKWAGMAASAQDGMIGPATIKALQKKLGTVVDGKVSNPSQMVKALQKWANNQ